MVYSTKQYGLQYKTVRFTVQNSMVYSTKQYGLQYKTVWFTVHNSMVYSTKQYGLQYKTVRYGLQYITVRFTVQKVNVHCIIQRKMLIVNVSVPVFLTLRLLSLIGENGTSGLLQTRQGSDSR